MASTSADVRKAFLGFFQAHGHEVVPSSSLVPHNDPTLMFTNAGMVQFKDVFVGKESRRIPRATSSQKCIRISGKHNDLENVGVTARHHTFFEMLGNFSFGDYFKEEAIVLAWKLLTQVYGLPPERLLITVFGGAEGIPADDEARGLWRKVTGFADERIIGVGGVPGDNFWQMGETGPCGPCTEIHWYNGSSAAAVPYATFGQEPSPDGLGWMELWNLVFMQFDRSIDEAESAKLVSLPKPCVDTGAGLERVASVMQGVTSNYDTDILRSLVAKAAAISGKSYGGSHGKDDISMRVIADHARTTAFLIAEGIFPDRAGRQYVLRRVMRRAIRHGHRLGIRLPFLHEVALAVVDAMGHDYPELEQRRELIASVTRGEEERFRETIERGLKILDEEIERLRPTGERVIGGETVFMLHDTFGFPPDLTQVIAEENGLATDIGGYERALEAQRARSEGSKLNDEAAVEQVWHGVHDKTGDVTFVGYDHESADATIVAIVRDGQSVSHAEEGETVAIVTDRTPFYGEAGGQVGDRGVIRRANTPAARLAVTDTQKPVPGLIAHLGTVSEGHLAVGDAVHLAVDRGLRAATRRNHSATHLLHWALRVVLGPQTTQKGSLVGPDRLRFDFSHNRPMSSDEIAAVEDRVNAKVLSDAPVLTEILTIDEARKRGAMAIFEEKYGGIVRMLTMTNDSIELCGGTHARTLGEIGLFKITGEQGLAAGVRRIEAVTGLNALLYTRSLEATVRDAARAVKGSPSDLAERVEKLVERERRLEREIADLNRKAALGAGSGSRGMDEVLGQARDVPGGKALAVRLQTGDAGTLREAAERFRDALGPSIVLVGAAPKDKAMLVLTVSKPLLNRYNAGNLIRPIAEILGGSGGGRADMAQAGGTKTARLDEALESLYGHLA